MDRTLSFVVPSGRLTIGNLLGAVQQWPDHQNGDDSLFGVADLHALTVEHDPATVRAVTVEQLALLIAAGLDPERCTLFVQSHVPAHAELHWLLEATAYDGELRRMIQYKEKSAKLTTVRSALLAYPVLMAADILLYGVRAVPVGDDQRQHLELARDLAIRFNSRYGRTFVVPEAVTPTVAARVMDLQEPTAKMSKSAPESATGVIRLLDPPDVVRRKITRAVTDSGREVVYDPDTRPGLANLLDITAACTGGRPEAVARGVASYREVKDACAEAVVAVLTPLQERYAQIAGDEPYLSGVMRRGAERARDLAAPTLGRAKKAIGLFPRPAVPRLPPGAR